MKKLDFNKDREENPFFYELVLSNYEENLKRARKNGYVPEGRENENLVGALIVKNGRGLEELMGKHVVDNLQFRPIDENKSIGDYLRIMDSKGFDGAILIDGERISEPVLLYNVIEDYLNQNTDTTDTKLDERLSSFVPDDFIHRDGSNQGFFGNEVPVGRRLGNRTRLAAILPQIYDGELKTYAVKRTARGGLNTGPVVMFGPNGLERMCYFKQENYAGGVLAVVKSYEFDPELGKVIETGECEFSPALLRPHKLATPVYVNTFA